MSRNRRCLTMWQQKVLSRLERAATLSPFEEGQLRTLAHLGDPQEAERATVALNSHRRREQ
jgi:hypothetical protein